MMVYEVLNLQYDSKTGNTIKVWVEWNLEYNNGKTIYNEDGTIIRQKNLRVEEI